MTSQYDTFMEFLKKEDRDACVDYALSELSLNRISIIDLYEHILTPALNNMGCDTDEKKLCIWKEHVRSSIVRTIIECCYPYIIKERTAYNHDKTGKKAVVICPDGEYHEIGARIVSDYFTLLGFNSVFVGSSTPKEEFLSVINVLNPEYIAISVTNYYNLVSAKKTISELRERSDKSIKVLVGGNAFKNNPKSFKEIGADALLQSFDDLKRFTEGR